VITATDIREARRDARRSGRQFGFFQERLRELREAKGMTREQLAFRSGLSVSTIQRMEVGFRAVPYYTSVEAVARVLGVEPNELI